MRKHLDHRIGIRGQHVPSESALGREPAPAAASLSRDSLAKCVVRGRMPTTFAIKKTIWLLHRLRVKTTSKSCQCPDQAGISQQT